MDIQYNGIIYRFDKELGLSSNQFFEKCWVISKQEPKNTIEYEKAEQLANIYINKKYLKCKYSENIEIKINNLSKKLQLSN